MASSLRSATGSTVSRATIIDIERRRCGSPGTIAGFLWMRDRYYGRAALRAKDGGGAVLRTGQNGRFGDELLRVACGYASQRYGDVSDSPPNIHRHAKGSASQMCIAFSSIASNTGARTPGDELMTRNTSAVAACCSSASPSSRSRAFEPFFQLGTGARRVRPARALAFVPARYGALRLCVGPFVTLRDKLASSHQGAQLCACAAQRPRRRAAEQRDELPPPHSITSSARASSVGGISRPSALAVLRLMTSSNLVGCTTGRSAGFSPLRIRPA